MMRAFGDSGVMLADADDAVVVRPGWRVVDRVDDPAPVTALNRVTWPRSVVDAAAVAVVPPAGSPARPSYHYVERSSDGTSTRSSEPVGPLSGTLAWWTTQKVYADTPLSNGTPGVDVRLLDDGRLAPEPGVEILEELRDPDVGGYLRAEQTLTVVARVRVADGRVCTRSPPRAEVLGDDLVHRRSPRPTSMRSCPGFARCTARTRGEPPAPLGGARGVLRRLRDRPPGAPAPIAHALCGDRHQADDLVQIALTRLYVACPRVAAMNNVDAYARRAW